MVSAPGNPEPQRAIGDSSDGTIEYNLKRNLHGWTIEEWIAAIKRHPDRSLPNGVGGAMVRHYESESR